MVTKKWQEKEEIIVSTFAYFCIVTISFNLRGREKTATIIDTSCRRLQEVP